MINISALLFYGLKLALRGRVGIMKQGLLTGRSIEKKVKRLLMVKKWAIMVSCTVLVVIGAVSIWMMHYANPSMVNRRVSYVTDIGEQRTVTLADGTTVVLNSDTWMFVDYYGDTRKVSLSRGGAYFQVNDERRPFQVAAGSGMVTAQDSAFAIAIDGSEMVISVAEGGVEVFSHNDASQRRILTALQKMAVGENQLGNIERLTQIEPDWLDGWLEYENETLGKVAAELDKYYHGHIQLEGAGLPQLRVSGRFKISDINKAIKVLAKSMGLKITYSEAANIVLSRENIDTKP